MPKHDWAKKSSCTTVKINSTSLKGLSRFNHGARKGVVESCRQKTISQKVSKHKLPK